MCLLPGTAVHLIKHDLRRCYYLNHYNCVKLFEVPVITHFILFTSMHDPELTLFAFEIVTCKVC